MKTGRRIMYAIIRRLAMLVLTGALIAWGGCQTPQQAQINIKTEGPPLPAASLPNYAVGEYFIFDDGTTKMVTEVSGEWITWQYDNGIVSKRYRNFVIPALNWRNAKRQSKAKTTAEADLLWPLAVGNEGHYDFRQTISKHDGTDVTRLSRSWNCTVEGTKRVRVTAGTFDTYVVTCRRYSDTSHKWRATRRFYYAPDLGHYVIREDKYRSRPEKKRELVSYGFNSTVLPKQDQIELNRLLQKALNNNADGIGSTWTSRSGELSAQLIPINSFTGRNGDECRDYHSVYSVNGRIRKNFRKVCRQSNGLWQRIE